MSDEMASAIGGLCLPVCPEILVPSSIPPDVTPIVAAIRCVQPMAEQTRHNETQGFQFGQTPLGGKSPLRGLGLRVLLSCCDTFDARAYEHLQPLCSHEGCEKRYQGNPS